MKGILSRARSSPRGGGDALVKEKEPFNVGPYRSKSASPGRKPRNNSENVPPDSNAHVSLVDAALISKVFVSGAFVRPLFKNVLKVFGSGSVFHRYVVIADCSWNRSLVFRFPQFN